VKFVAEVAIKSLDFLYGIFKAGEMSVGEEGDNLRKGHLHLAPLPTWSRGLIENLIANQLVKKFPVFFM
jgi:hypothetical protein